MLSLLKGTDMKWTNLDEARMLAKELTREYRHPKRDENRIDQLLAEIRELVPEEQGALVKTSRGWRVKIWSGSPRDKRPDSKQHRTSVRRKAA